MNEKQLKINLSINKAFAIIEIMANSGQEMRLQDIAKQVDMPQATALRIIYTLMKLGYVIQNKETMKYSLSLKFSLIGKQVEARMDLLSLIKPHLLDISRLSGEASCLSTEDNWELLYIDTVDGQDNILKVTQKIGKRAPLYCTGAGKIYLAYKEKEEVEMLLKKYPLVKLTETTINTKAELYAEFERIKNTGYSLDNEECEVGVKCIAFPIKNYDSKVIATVSVTGPSSRMTEEKLELIKGILVEQIKEVELSLGYQA